jgi:Kinesin motor domain
VSAFQTGSGKTHTMIGANVLHHEERGLVPRIMEHIFHVQAASPPQFVYETRCSFIEIYLDKLSDLLAPVKARALKLRERGDGSFFTTATQVWAIAWGFL